jgi:choline kinase
MMKRSRGKAIILSAGQGRRLLPYTANVPKCLVEVAGRTVLDWQLRALKAAGIGQVALVIGFEADKVEAHVAAHCPFGLDVRTYFNPRFAEADNLISCLTVRDEMNGDFLLLNGDTLFEATAITRLRQSERAPVSVAVATKDAYDADDMKVSCKGVLVTHIDKQVPADRIDGEAIGISLFRDRGPQRFLEALEQIAGEPEAHRRWYLSAVNLLAKQGLVRAVAVDDLRWAEIDYPADLERAESLVSYWQNRRVADEAPIPVRETA